MTEAPESEPRPPESILDVIGRTTGQVPEVSLSGAGADGDAAPVSLDPSTDIEFAERTRGNYQVLGEVARGGMGAVLRAHDSDLRRDVAIKVLDERLAGRPEVVQRFVEEAQIGAQLQHPGVVPVYELGLMADERPFFTMKLVKGRTLASMLAARKSPDVDLRRFLAIFEQICQTIAYAHSKGVLHRDLKPANIMVGAFGEVQVVDWGLAKVLGQGGVVDELRSQRDQNTVIDTVRSGPGSSGSDSLVGSVLGTPAYMPPEQARGEIDALDERTDVFALGALLCEMLTGAAPYVDDGEQAVVLQAARALLEPARERLAASGADETLRALALDCMAPAAQSRPASAEEVARVVQEHLSSAEDRAREAQLEATAARVREGEERKRRRLAIALGGTVVTLLVALGAGYVWIQGQREEHRQSVRRQLDELQAAALGLQAEERHDEALVKAREALELTSAEGLPAETRSRVGSFLEKVEQATSEANERKALAARNAEFFARLDAARLLRSQIGVSATPQDVDLAYAEAFADYGLDVDSEDLVATLETLRGRGLGEELGLAVDDWARMRRALLGWTAPEAEALTALAADLDTDPMRTDVRAALLERDTAELLSMQAELDVEHVPPATTWVLAGAVGDVGEDPTALLERAVRRHPGDERFRILLGFTHMRGERTEAAQRHFEAAHALRPDNVYVINQLARLARVDGVYAMALHLYRELEDRVGESSELSISSAFCLLMLGRNQEAAEAFERGAELGPLDGEDLLEHAAARYFTNELSVEEFMQATEDVHSIAYRGQLRAWALLEHPDPFRRDVELALDLSMEAVRINPEFWLPWYDLAVAQLRSGLHAEMLETLSYLKPVHNLRWDAAFASAALYALANHHLGNAEAAVDWRNRAGFLFENAAGGDPDAWSASSFYAHLREARALIE